MTVRLVLISWTAGPLLQQAPVVCDSLRLVRPYVGGGSEPPDRRAGASTLIETESETTTLHHVREKKEPKLFSRT